MKEDPSFGRGLLSLDREVVRIWEEDRRGAIRRFLSPLPKKKARDYSWAFLHW